MSGCELCALAEGQAPFTVYEDKIVKAILVPKPASPGHMLLFPKSHHTIFEQVPDAIIQHLFVIANKLSTAVFESLNMHGTNILVHNGTASGQQHAHFSINILPRNENDGLKLEWKPKQLSEEEMSTLEILLKPHTEVLSGVAEVAEKPEPAKEQKKESLKDDSGNYLVRQLRRIP